MMSLTSDFTGTLIFHLKTSADKFPLANMSHVIG